MISFFFFSNEKEAKLSKCIFESAQVLMVKELSSIKIMRGA